MNWLDLLNLAFLALLGAMDAIRNSPKRMNRLVAGAMAGEETRENLADTVRKVVRDELAKMQEGIRHELRAEIHATVNRALAGTRRRLSALEAARDSGRPANVRRSRRRGQHP
jgi:hypothetical protein